MINTFWNFTFEIEFGFKRVPDLFNNSWHIWPYIVKECSNKNFNSCTAVWTWMKKILLYGFKNTDKKSFQLLDC